MRKTPFETPDDAAGSPARLEYHVRMLAETLAPRDHAHPENLRRIAAYIADAFREAGAVGVFEQVYTADGLAYRNVVARFGPEADGPRGRVVLGAHYDAAGPLPGADDNASGVAGLIEAAYLLGADPTPPAARVDLVAFCLEEPPFFATDRMGSAVHAASLREAGARVRAMLCLEMIGYYSDAPDSQRFPDERLRGLYPSVGDFLTIAGRPDDAALARTVEAAMRAAADPLPIYSLIAPAEMPGIGLSDHRSYWRQGYPAVMLTDGAFYRNPHYHTESDTPDTLDYRRMALAVRGIHAALRSLADGA